MSARRSKVLWLGRPIVYEHELFTKFNETFDIVYKTETERGAFLKALKSGTYGDFEAVIKPMVEYGCEWGRFDVELIEALPLSMKIFGCGGAGYDWIDLEAVSKKGILYCNSRGAGDEATSDHSVWLIISCFRLGTYSELLARSGDPKAFLEDKEFIAKNAVNPGGKILGCLGLGAIARRTAKKATAFGLKIYYYDVARAPEEVEKDLDAIFCETKEALLQAKPDCINISVPYMPSTHHLVDEDFLKGMKPGSRIVNTARGQVVDESALVKALNSGHILSAGLDVHYEEPIVNPELIANKRVTLTSHIGGVTQNTHQGFEHLSMENITRVLKDQCAALTPVNAADIKWSGKL